MDSSSFSNPSMSVVVRMPTREPFSTTGNALILRVYTMATASAIVVSGDTTKGLAVIAFVIGVLSKKLL